uniref:Ig-like domain-containing protein n=1 Tax=Echeneis naucrates TaxID=173247 RepID=A0A665TIE9_ECHNA
MLRASFPNLFLDPPSFVKLPQPVEELKGKDVSLYCEMSGTAPFQVTWFKDRKPLMESRKYKVVSEGNSATLHVIGIEPSDAGEYECKVSNSVGSDTCQTTALNPLLCPGFKTRITFSGTVTTGKSPLRTTRWLLKSLRQMQPQQANTPANSETMLGVWSVSLT